MRKCDQVMMTLQHLLAEQTPVSEAVKQCEYKYSVRVHFMRVGDLWQFSIYYLKHMNIVEKAAVFYLNKDGVRQTNKTVNASLALMDNFLRSAG